MTGADASTRRRRVLQRRLAWGLVAYGVIGLLISVTCLAAVITALPSIDALDRQQADIVRWLDLATKGLTDAERGMSNAGASTSAAAVSARSAATLSDDLATTMASLRDASGLTVLGTQPFGSLTDDFDRVADRSRALSASFAGLAGSLDGDAADFATVSTDAAALRVQIADLRAALADHGSGSIASALQRIVAVIVLMFAWLATPALASLIGGAFWLRELDPEPDVP